MSLLETIEEILELNEKRIHDESYLERSNSGVDFVILCKSNVEKLCKVIQQYHSTIEGCAQVAEQSGKEVDQKLAHIFRSINQDAETLFEEYNKLSMNL